MTKFETYTIDNAPNASKPLMETARDAYGFVPNLLGTMAESPALLEGYMTLAGIFDQGILSETERQIILMTNNRLNGCHYCMAAHTAISKMAGVSNEVIESLRNDTPIEDPKLEALRTFASVINEKRGWPDESEINEFLDAGYNREAVLEVILGTSLKLMSNYTNHIAETKLDDAFAVESWTNAAS